MVLLLPRKTDQTLGYTNSQKQKLKSCSFEGQARYTAKGNDLLPDIPKKTNFAEKLVSVFEKNVDLTLNFSRSYLKVIVIFFFTSTFNATQFYFS